MNIYILPTSQSIHYEGTQSVYDAIKASEIGNNRDSTTGVIYGGEVTRSLINPTTHFNVAAGVGRIVNHSTYPSTVVNIAWDALNEVAATANNTGVFTRIEILSNATLSQTNVPQTDSDRQSKIQLGILIHEVGGVITNAFSAPNPEYNHTGEVRDLAEAIGTIVTSGLVFTANGANLKLNRSQGSAYVYGRAYGTNKNFPSNVTQGTASPVSFYYNYRNGSGGFTSSALTTDIAPNVYDNGTGTLAAVSNNKYTIQYIYYYPEHDNTFIMYGQNLYDSVAEAKAAIGSEVVSHTPRLFRAALRAYLIVKGATTSLSVTADAVFIAGSKISGITSTGGGSGGGGSDLYTGTAERTVGGITDGQVFTAQTMTQMWDALIKQEKFPTLTAPSSTFTMDITGLREVGEVLSLNFSSTFNQGSISPQYTAASPYRSGLPNQYQFTGTGLVNENSTLLTNSKNIASYTVLINSQNWQGRVAYDAGVQPKSSYGNDYSTPLSAGSTAYVTRTITGVYPFFATTVNLTTMTKASLQSHGSAATVSMVAEDGVDKQKFEVAVAYGTLSSIQQYNTLSGQWDTISTGTFTMTTVNRTIQGQTVSYRLYTHNGATIGARQVRFNF